MIESTTPKDNTLNKEKNGTEEIMEPSVNLKRKHKTKSENNKKLSTLNQLKLIQTIIKKFLIQ